MKQCDDRFWPLAEMKSAVPDVSFEGKDTRPEAQQPGIGHTP
jgi:hypothetical protein